MNFPSHCSCSTISRHALEGIPWPSVEACGERGEAAAKEAMKNPSHHWSSTWGGLQSSSGDGLGSEKRWVPDTLGSKGKLLDSVLSNFQVLKNIVGYYVYRLISGY